jgi:hypothetical protein
MITIKRNSFITILSTRKSGKSFLVAQLIHNFLTNPKANRCEVLYMFSNTAKFEEGGNYGFVDRRCIFKASQEIVDRVVNRLLDVQLKTGKRYHVLLVFDDIDLGKKYDQSIERLATMGRHYNITTILSAQVATNAISPAIRNNTSYLFIRKLNAETLKKQIYSMVISGEFQNPEEFKDFVNENNVNYQFIFYDNDDDQKSVHVVKADPIPTDFRYVVREPEKKARKRTQICADIPLYNH